MQISSKLKKPLMEYHNILYIAIVVYMSLGKEQNVQPPSQAYISI